MRRACLVIAAGAVLLALGDVRPPAQGAYEWTLPAGFRPPGVPGDNPMSEAKVTLGRYLFYDTRLSGNGTQSCGTCHEQSRAFTVDESGRAGAGADVRRAAGRAWAEPG